MHTGDVAPREVSRAFSGFSKVARARRLYPATSPILERMMQDLMQVFGELFSRHEEISLRVRPEAFLFEDEEVLVERDPDDSIPFAFFRDGIRRLDLGRGLSRHELDVLFGAAAQGFQYSPMGDDVVSFLWRHDLEHVHYVVVDASIVDANTDNPGANTELERDGDKEIDALLFAIYGAGTEDVGPRSIHVDRSDIAAKAIAQSLDHDEDSDARVQPARNLDGTLSYQDALMAELAAETDDALRLRWLYAALEGFAVGDDSPAHDAIARGLLDLFDSRLVMGDLDGAAQVIASVRGLQTLPAAERRALAWVEQAAVETRLRPLVSATIERGPRWEEALQRFFAACGPSAMSTLFSVLPGVAEPATRRALLNLAVNIGVADLAPVVQLLSSEQAFLAQDAVFLLAHVATPEAIAVLQEATRHPAPQVRWTLLEHVDKIPAETAQEIAAIMLGDEDARIAAHAARVLASIPGEGAVAAVEAQVRAPRLLDMKMEYKVALLETYAQLHGPKALPLLAKYVVRAESRSTPTEAEDLAVAAVQAMRFVVTPGTVKALKTAAGYWNKRVRDEARSVIQRLKEGT